MSLNKPKIATLFVNDALSTKLYKESVTLKTKGRWREAGDKLIACARIHGILRMQLEAATLYTEAAESLMKVDKGEALMAYNTSIRLYCDIGRFDVAGKLERKVADINYYAKHYDEAAAHYRKAGNFLSGDLQLDQSDFCMARAAECLLKLGEYLEASSLFRIVAQSCINTNLRRFNSKDYWFRSLLCILGLPIFDPENLDGPQPIRTSKTIVFEDADEKYTYLLEQSDAIDAIDYMWKGCVEKKFLENIAVARHKGDQHDIIDQLYFWNQVKPLDALSMQLLKRPYDEVLEDIAYQKRVIESKHQRMQADAGSVHSINTSISGRSDATPPKKKAQGKGQPPAHGSGSFSGPPSVRASFEQAQAAASPNKNRNSILSAPDGRGSVSISDLPPS